MLYILCKQPIIRIKIITTIIKGLLTIITIINVLKNNNNGLDGETLCLPFAYLDPAKIPDTLLTTPPLQHLIY